MGGVAGRKPQGAYGAQDVGTYSYQVFVQGFECTRQGLWPGRKGVNDYTALQLEILCVYQESTRIDFAAELVGLVLLLSVAVGMLERWPRW